MTAYGKSRIMKRRLKPWHWLIMAFTLVAILAVVFFLPKNPTTTVKIVDDAGNAVSGVTVEPYALRPKPEGGHSGHYVWTKDRYDVLPEPVVTDEKGVAIIPYPKFLVERVETGEITVSIRHPRYVSDNYDIVASTSLPGGAPWNVWMKNIIGRLKNGTATNLSNTIVIREGQILSLEPSEMLQTSTTLYAQTSSKGGLDIDFWDRSQPGVLISRKHAPSDHVVRLIGLTEDNKLMFSDTTDVTIKPDVTNSLSLILKPGRTVRGRIGESVPRPVVNGRVVANIIPSGRNFKDDPPNWHTWTKVNEDGSFEMPSLPAGDMEIVALCNGYVSVNSTGQGQPPTIGCPQKHVLGADDLDIVIEMEPTARLEVTVYEENGQLLEGARVWTWPNVRWDDWGSTIFCSDLYNTIDRLKQPYERKNRVSQDSPPGFFGISDKNGVAILSNVPAWVTHFAVEHPDHVLPKLNSTIAVYAPRREARIVLQPGAVTETTVILEPRGRDPRRHY